MRAFAVTLILSLFLAWVDWAGPLAGPQVPDDPATQVELKLRLERHFPENLPIREGLRWTFQNPLAMSPQGDRVAVLVPHPWESGLRRRRAAWGTERSFELEWIRVTDGTVLHSRTLDYRRHRMLTESFGIAISDSSGHLCTLASGEILILDGDFEIVARFPTDTAELSRYPLRAQRCGFFPESNLLFVLLIDEERLRRSAFAVYEWSDGGPRRIHFSVSSVQYQDAVPVGATRVVAISLEPAARYRYRLSEIDLTQQKPRQVWRSFVNENGWQRLRVTKDLVLRGEWEYKYPVDRIKIVWGGSEYDADNPPELSSLPSPNITGRIRTWARPTGHRRFEYGVTGYDTMWPIAISTDGRWLAARLIHFTTWNLHGQHLWDDVRFAVFEVGEPSAPLYISENFGAEEAVTGMAFTLDRKALVVTTSRRLLVYDIHSQ